jgi:tetratricopeptide (TPR) repeat protein
LQPKNAAPHMLRGLCLGDMGEWKQANKAFQEAARLDPEWATPHEGLGLTFLKLGGELDRAIQSLEKAASLRPKASVYTELAGAYAQKNEDEKATEYFRKALDLEKDDLQALLGLANIELEKGRAKTALPLFIAATKAHRKDAQARCGLGLTYLALGKVGEAIVELERAVDLKPGFGLAHCSLGHANLINRNWLKAEVSFSRALGIGSQDAEAQAGLGIARFYLDDMDGAISACRRAIALNGRDAKAHHVLGKALLKNVALGKLPVKNSALEDAVAALSEAAKLDGFNAEVHFDLASALTLTGKHDAAVQAFEAAIERKPQYAQAYYALSNVRLNQGKFHEALKAAQSADKLRGGKPSFPLPTEQLVKEAEYCLKLDQELAKGKLPANARERCDYARVASFKGLHVDAARLYEQAFAEQPELGGNLGKKYRYYAAGAAALVGSEPGDANLPEAERSRWRKQALIWLRADLDEWTKLLRKSPDLVRQRMHQWRRNQDLKGLRDAEALARLPEEEQRPWKQLWTDVDELLQKIHVAFRETRLRGELTVNARERVHEVKLLAGSTCIIDLQSQAFDTFLRLEDANGKKLAENDDISPANLNSRLVFTPENDGVYRLVATSFEQRGVGPYTLTVRESIAPK